MARCSHECLTVDTSPRLLPYFSATSNVLEGASKYAFDSSWLTPGCLIPRLVLLWSDSRSPGGFPSRGSHSRRRHVHVEAEHAKGLYDQIERGVFVPIPAIVTVRIRTHKHPIDQLKIVFARSTAVTKLTRREKPIHFEQHAALARDAGFPAHPAACRLRRLRTSGTGSDCESVL